MAAVGIGPDAGPGPHAAPGPAAAASTIGPVGLLRAAGSLKITVAMFLAATFLLFVGTLAQDEKSLPEVKAEYFTSWLALVPLADFLPVTIFGETRVPGWFPFPGGATIGLVLLANLVAAKATRFQVAARGRRLAWGGLVTLLGCLLTAGVILTGHRADGLQGRPPLEYDTVWRLVQVGGAFLAGGLAAAARQGRRGLVSAALWTAAAAVGSLVAVTLVGGDAWRMGDPGLRIMWQLIQSSVAAAVLLTGLSLVFGARGGNVLIHAAVGLLMVGQFFFGDRQIEERISLVEGQTTSVAYRTDEVELAAIDTSGTAADRVTAISGRLVRARAGGEPIVVPALPFDVQVLDFHPNSAVVRVGPVAPNRATAGLGLEWRAEPRPPEGGSSSRPNVASAYVRLLERGTGRDLGSFLTSQFLNDRSRIFMGGDGDECDTVQAGGAEWRLALRFRREVKPYGLTLDDVRRIDYSASETPRDYSSYVTFTDLATGARQKGRIWMNNPVRYRGETFYQSQYSTIDLGGGRTAEMTGLQVVENAGWLIPYVACVLAFWGMLAHFGLTFLRFADRHERASGRERHGGGWLPAAVGLAVVAFVALPRMREPVAAGGHDWRAAGTIPAMHEGRVKPLDTVARNLLQLLGNRTTVRMPADAASASAPTATVPATRWLLALMAGSEWAADAPVFRIDAFELLDLLDIARRPGHRYSARELERGREAVRGQARAARETPPERRSFVQKKAMELEQKLMAYDLVRFAYDTPSLPQPAGEGEEQRRELLAQVRRLVQGARMITENHPPAAIPPVDADAAAAADGSASGWQALYPAVVSALVGRAAEGRGGQPAFRLNPAILPFTELLAAVDGTAAEFNGAVAAYRDAIDDLPAVRASAATAGFEAWLNRFNPTDTAKWLYLLAGIVCLAAFLVDRPQLQRFTWWLLAGTLLLHTFAVAARIHITGRPPVVNLYSSAVFIGWACVLAGLALESLHRIGIGNLVAALGGGLTLMVAYGLDTGDTMHVLQAVLDTQFWLSTHVVTVTLGYGATFLAGLLGTCSLVHAIRGRLAGRPPGDARDRDVRDRLHRMTYGVVCFALFFSFIGTVLGGLWADDSWGRFWGWDPKENGALMIVLWNAAVLHARWDRWIGPRGFALFAVGGNIVTAWSWFGTNQLGIGLHSYGFTSGVLLMLAGYVASQLALIAAGLLLVRPVTAPAATGRG